MGRLSRQTSSLLRLLLYWSDARHQTTPPNSCSRIKSLQYSWMERTIINKYIYYRALHFFCSPIPISEVGSPSRVFSVAFKNLRPFESVHMVLVNHFKLVLVEPRDPLEHPEVYITLITWYHLAAVIERHMVNRHLQI
jgi:hypothetical protein